MLSGKRIDDDKSTAFELLCYLANEYCENKDYQTDGFMRPQWMEGSMVEHDWFEDSGDWTQCHLAPMVIRLSASGYLDCTEWTPIEDDEDLEMWFDTFCTTD